MTRAWTKDEILETARGYQRACVLVAAADLDLFAAVGEDARPAREIARAVDADERGATVLLDALVALDLLEKQEGRYRVRTGVREVLTAGPEGSLLAMVRHQGKCQRRWSRLAEAVRSGAPCPVAPSVRGADADSAAFIEAMNDVNAPVAAAVIEDVAPARFRHLLDVGGASGTWTIAWLRRRPDARATIFDLPHVIDMAERRIGAAGLGDRVDLVAGDFDVDPLPAGADLAWLSAIVHQNSRERNRALFRAVFAALSAGGRILVRDVVMEESRVRPAAGALFAVNMLTATAGGGTFTFAELREDIESAGFADVALLRDDGTMNSVVGALKPA